MRKLRLFTAVVLPMMLVMSVAGVRPASAAPANGALGQNLPPGPTAVYQAKVPVSGLSGEFELKNIILDFAPGSATPSHTHGGPGIVTVLEGEISNAVEGKAEQIVKTGESWVELPGEHAVVGNKGTTKARVSFAIALPKGAALTTPKGGTPTANPPPGPTTVYSSTLPGITVPGDFELTNLILDFAPGSATPSHTHGGPGIVTVLEGQISNAVEGKAEQIVKTGESWTELPGEYAVVGNKGTANARVSFAVALPKGAPLTTVKQSGAQTFTGMMGQEIFTVPGEKSTWQALRFYPEKLTINAGDSIMWKHDAGVEPHTVSLPGPSKFPGFVLPPEGAPGGAPPPGGAPSGPPPKLEVNPMVLFPQGGKTYDGSAYVNSGVIAADIPGPKEYTLTFSKPGTYKFVCLVHSGPTPDGTIGGMRGEVVVQAAGSALPMTPAQVAAETKSMMDADGIAARAAEPDAKKSSVSTMPGEGGTTIHHVNTGFFLPAGTIGAVLDYERFSPQDIAINVGDTVEWSSPTPHNFHNVLFGEEPEAIMIEPQPSGPPKGFLNPLGAFPAGPKVHTGTGVYSSGTITGPEDPPFGPSVTSYSLAFSEPGRYEYICLYHYHNGMDGNVVVNARTGGQPGMPTTGNPDNWSIVMALLVALATTLAGLSLRLRVLSRRSVVK